MSKPAEFSESRLDQMRRALTDNGLGEAISKCPPLTPAPRLQDRLRACPFCGGEAKRSPSMFGEDFISCNGTQGKHHGLCHMREGAWNTRPELDRLEKLVEEAREVLKPFAELSDKRELEPAFAAGYMPLHVGIMNGNVTQSVIRGALTVNDVRRARSLLSRMNKETGE